MSIQFHCNHCNKKIEAADSAGGKWGKCPACHNKVYIPDLNTGEELKLAPIDKGEEKRKKRLMAETYQLSHKILEERSDEQEAEAAKTRISEKELTKNIILYLKYMADGDLEQAEKLENKIKPCGGRAMAILEKIALSEIPEPELAEIPQQVLASFIRTLRTKISG